MKVVFVSMSLMFFHLVLNACPNCVGSLTEMCPPFFSAACYTASINDEDYGATERTQDDVLILKGEQDHEERK